MMVRPPNQTVENLHPRPSILVRCNGRRAFKSLDMLYLMDITCTERIPLPTLAIINSTGIRFSKLLVIDTASPVELSTTAVLFQNMASQIR